MDFDLTPEQQRLQDKCRELAADFATRSTEHDRDASHPVENYDRLREEAFFAQALVVLDGMAGVSIMLRRPGGEAGCELAAFVT